MNTAAAAIPAAGAAGPTPVISKRPWLGILAVLLGAIASTLSTRLTSNGLADIRGAIGVGIDEGAWIPTAFTASQMLMGPASVWLGKVFGVRLVLLWGAITFGVAEALIPLSPNLSTILVLQAFAGLGSAVFIPLTIGFILQNLPPKLWAFGVGAYAMNIELSLNIAATIEGWYSEHSAWQWIFWQNALFAVPLAACIWFGIPPAPYDRETARTGDYWGMVFASVGLAVLYAALDQGDRLDWLGSDLIVGMLCTGLLLIALFLLYETTAAHPGIDFSLLLRRNLMLSMLLIVLIRYLLTASSYLVPQFLQVVRGLRPQQVGDVLLWVAVPQVVLAPTVAWLVNRLDARYLQVVGMLFLIVANFHASFLTSAWAEENFIVPQLLTAIGQSLALISLLFVVVRNLPMDQILAFGALLQTARLFGGQLGSAGLQVFSRKMEQVHSNLLGQHVGTHDLTTLERLHTYTGILLPNTQGTGAADARAVGALSETVRTQAFTLTYADGYLLSAGVALLGLLMVLCLRRPAS